MLPPFPDDSGELPGSNVGNRIRLLVQSPLKLYLYWEYAPSSSETPDRNSGTQAARSWEVVKLVELESGVDIIYGASPTRTQWFNVHPGRIYRAHVGLIDQWGTFYCLLSSDEVRTPRSYLARSPSITPDPTRSAWDYARMLNEMGYISDALEVFLEAADSMTRVGMTPGIAREYSGVKVPLMTDPELAEMRQLLVAIALESHYEHLLREVSAKSLRDWLTATWLHQPDPDLTDDLNAAHLREVFHLRLGIEISRIPPDPFDDMAMRRVIGTDVGSGSYAHLPYLAFYVWIPSMAFSPATRSGFSLQPESR